MANSWDSNLLRWWLLAGNCTPHTGGELLGRNSLLSDGEEEGTLNSLVRSIDGVNITLQKLLQASKNQGEVLGHFIFQYFTTAPRVRAGEEEAVRLSTRERFIDFIDRIKTALKAGRSIFELGSIGQ